MAQETPEEIQGILPRVMRQLFARAGQVHAADPDKRIRYSCQFVEIYQDELRDLLQDPEEQQVNAAGQAWVSPAQRPSARERAAGGIQLQEEKGQMRLVGASTIEADNLPSMIGVFEASFEPRDPCCSPVTP